MLCRRGETSAWSPTGQAKVIYAIWSREASESPPTDLRVLVYTSNTSTQWDWSRALPSASVRTCTQKLTWVICDSVHEATVPICSHSPTLVEYYFSIRSYQKHHLLSLLFSVCVPQSSFCRFISRKGPGGLAALSKVLNQRASFLFPFTANVSSILP